MLQLQLLSFIIHVHYLNSRTVKVREARVPMKTNRRKKNLNRVMSTLYWTTVWKESLKTIASTCSARKGCVVWFALCVCCCSFITLKLDIILNAIYECILIDLCVYKYIFTLLPTLIAAVVLLFVPFRFRWLNCQLNRILYRYWKVMWRILEPIWFTLRASTTLVAARESGRHL